MMTKALTKQRLDRSDVCLINQGYIVRERR
jgi:hypothetical protein